MIRYIYFLIILMSCATPVQENVIQIDAEKLIQLQESGIQVIDIRTKKEYDQGHIPNVMHIDFRGSDFMQKMESLGKTTPIIIHCAVGGRSGKAANLLQNAGFERIYDYTGGFSDWKSKGLEIE